MGKSERGREAQREGRTGRPPRVRSGGPGARETDRSRGLALGRASFLILAAAAVSIIAGYVMLDRGSVTAAPILLVLGYVVLVPAGLLIGSRSTKG